MNSKNGVYVLLAVIVIGVGAIFLINEANESPLENAAEDLGEAAEEVGDGLEDAGN